MGLIEYEQSKALAVGDPSFYAFIMAAMRKADTTNTLKLQRMWPDVWDEMQQRYNAPGGALTEAEMTWLNNQQEEKE